MHELAPKARERPHELDTRHHGLDLGLGRVQAHRRLPTGLPRDGGTVQEHHEARGSLGTGVREVSVKRGDKLISVVVGAPQDRLIPVVRQARAEVPKDVAKDVMSRLDVVGARPS